MLDKVSKQSLLEQIIGARDDPVAIKSVDYRFVAVNKAFCKHVGFEACDLIGKNDLELGRAESLVLGDPATGWPGLWAFDDRAIEHCSKTRYVETGFNGRNDLHTVRTPLMDDGGNVIGLMVELVDVREVHELKRRVANNLDALSIRDGEITTLDSVLASLLACQDTETLLSYLAAIIVERTGADGAYVSTLHETGAYLNFVAAQGVHAAQLLGTRHQWGDGVVGMAWERGEVIFGNEAIAVGDQLRWEPMTQTLVIPLMLDGATVAALSVVSGPMQPDLGKEIALLERIAGVATVAIANTRLMDTTAQTLRRTRALSEISRMLTTVDDSCAACDSVCRTILSVVDVTRSSCYLVDESGQLRPHVSWAVDEAEPFRTDTIPESLVPGALAHWCLENREVGYIKRLDDDPRESAAVHAFRREFNVGSTCCAPLLRRGEPVGLIVVSRARNQRDLDETDIDVFKAIANQLSTVIERHELASELQHQAFHDQLTALPNRHQFELELERSIRIARENSTSVWVQYIDLDGFKEVNDTNGHTSGDQLLKLVAGRLSQCIDSRHMLARMGGDEFATIVCVDDAHGDDALATAQCLLDSLSTEFVVRGERIKVGASIGLSQFPADGDNVDELLRSADIAMYQAKNSEETDIFRFDETLAIDLRNRVQLEKELREALENEEFRLVYQPQVRCSDHRVVGVEALIRWVHPTRGLVPPAEFIPLAERTGQINRIGAWVIETAARQLANWQGTSLGGVRVSINIAAPQLQLESFSADVLDVLQCHGVPVSLLELEVTESVVMNDVSSVVRHLNHLRNAGMRIAIDDFGTGYSSLSYLQELPLDVLKIDRSFVTRLATEDAETSLANTIQFLADRFGLITVAEGVETVQQCNAIMQLGCTLIQGYLYSKPVAAEELPKVVTDIQGLASTEPRRDSRPAKTRRSDVVSH